MVKKIVGALSGRVRGITEVIAEEDAFIWRVPSETMDHYYWEIILPEFSRQQRVFFVQLIFLQLIESFEELQDKGKDQRQYIRTLIEPLFVPFISEHFFREAQSKAFIINSHSLKDAEKEYDYFSCTRV